jgi:hypothetical protein
MFARKGFEIAGMHLGDVSVLRIAPIRRAAAKTRIKQSVASRRFCPNGWSRQSTADAAIKRRISTACVKLNGFLGRRMGGWARQRPPADRRLRLLVVEPVHAGLQTLARKESFETNCANYHEFFPK